MAKRLGVEQIATFYLPLAAFHDLNPPNPSAWWGESGKAGQLFMNDYTLIRNRMQLVTSHVVPHVCNGLQLSMARGLYLNRKTWMFVRTQKFVYSVIVVSKSLKSIQIQPTPPMHLRYLWDFQPHQGNKNSPERQAARFLFQTLVGTGIDGAISRSSASKFRLLVSRPKA